MLLSMTGYGRALISTRGGPLEVELHSVNRKALDINIQIPRELLYLDVEMRHFIAEFIERGQVTLRLARRLNGALPSLAEIKRVKEEWEKIRDEVGLAEEVTLSFLASQLSQIPMTQDLSFDELLPGLKEAMEGLMSMKRAEGKALQQEFIRGLEEISEKVLEIGPLVPKSVERHREKILQRINELEFKGDPDRIAFEATLFADRIDISEEIARLLSHVDQFKGSFAKKTAGRELNFLLQEMTREITTILSKSQDIDLTKKALEVKSVIEKMKEQVANIE